MLIEEARWLKSVLEDLAPGPGSVLLDVGSSSEYFRRVDQPYIDYFIFWPLRKRGVRIVHVDAREDEGVDVVCDIADPASAARVAQIPKGDIVLCSNMLEHVVDRALVIDRLKELTKPGGHLIVTVPHLYRYHEDPIDTMYRPTDAELAAAFLPGEFSTVRSAILDAACGYVTRPEKLLPYLAFRARNSFRFRVLRRPVEPERCKVAVVVLRKAPNPQRLQG